MLEIRVVTHDEQNVDFQTFERPQTIHMLVNMLKYIIAGTDMVAWINSFKRYNISVTIMEEK